MCVTVHVANFPEADLVHQVLSIRDDPRGRRQRGRPRGSWVRQIGSSCRECLNMGRGRGPTWRLARGDYWSCQWGMGEATRPSDWLVLFFDILKEQSERRCHNYVFSPSYNNDDLENIFFGQKMVTCLSQSACGTVTKSSVWELTLEGKCNSVTFITPIRSISINKAQVSWVTEVFWKIPIVENRSFSCTYNYNIFHELCICLA